MTGPWCIDSVTLAIESGEAYRSEGTWQCLSEVSDA